MQDFYFTVAYTNYINLYCITGVNVILFKLCMSHISLSAMKFLCHHLFTPTKGCDYIFPTNIFFSRARVFLCTERVVPLNIYNQMNQTNESILLFFYQN